MKEEKSEINFTREEIDLLNKFRQTHKDIIQTLGSVVVQRLELQAQEEKLNNTENQFKLQHAENQTKKRELEESLNKKYGGGSLDLTTGVFTPILVEQIPDKTEKIFNLGMPRTGTTSFHYLMEKVQLKSVHDGGIASSVGGGIAVDTFDSFSGTLSDLYEILYNKFPNAKYVLTIRDELDWLKSARRHFCIERGEKNSNYRIRLFGTARVWELTDEELLKMYNGWNDKITNFFEGKDNFMEINFINCFSETKQLCQKLLKFLEVDTSDLLFPNEFDFPHENRNGR